MQDNFIEDPQKLQAGMFAYHNPRVGAKTLLNVNLLPDLLNYLKKQLNSQQLLKLQQSHIQNYLVELALNYNASLTLDCLVQTILKHIRANDSFWYRHNNQQAIAQQSILQHKAVRSYLSDVNALQSAFTSIQAVPYLPQHPRKTSMLNGFQQLHPIDTQIMRQSFNQLMYIPQFVKQQIEVSIQQEQMLKQFLLFVVSNRKKMIQQTEQRSSLNEEDEQEDADFQGQEKKQEEGIMQQFSAFVAIKNKADNFNNSPQMDLVVENLIHLCLRILQTKSNQKIENFQGDIPESISTLLNQIHLKQFTQIQKNQLTNYYHSLWIGGLNQVTQELRKNELASMSGQGWLDSKQEIASIRQAYNNMLENPQFLQLTKYRTTLTGGVPWKQPDYQRFLKGLLVYLNIPTNNKKIAVFMGNHIQPNHVKHVKGIYLTVLKERMQRGDGGGGKRGKSLSRADFIEKDIASFSMKWFEKAKKIKKKRVRRRRKSSLSDSPSENVDSQY